MARMVLDDTSICFSNCHLAAGQSHVRQRNKDLVDILDSGDALPAVADFAPNACTSLASFCAASLQGLLTLMGLL